MSSLSHSMTQAVRHRRQFDRHKLVEPIALPHKPAGML